MEEMIPLNHCLYITVYILKNMMPSCGAKFFESLLKLPYISGYLFVIAYNICKQCQSTEFLTSKENGVETGL
jgi:hypothetical protein